jgi:NAD(P)-dependent dehydrogenase (short-subunit alcohol dehydrogenase family)
MMSNWTNDNIPDQTGKIAIVTGANSGIGFETAKALAEKRATVIMACRNPDKAQAAMAEIKKSVPEAKLEFIPLDLSDLASIKAFARTFQEDHDRLDMLINNAGIMMPPYSKTKDGFEVQFGANHLGHFALTGLLMPTLRKTKGARVVNVSSVAHRMGTGTINFEDLHAEKGYNPMRSYAQSKLANLLFTRQLNSYFQTENITALSTSAHPGWTATNLQAHSPLSRILNPLFSQTPPVGALPTLYAATTDREANDYAGPGGWQEMRGYPKLVDMSHSARDNALATRLWDVSEKLTGVNYPAKVSGTVIA